MKGNKTDKISGEISIKNVIREIKISEKIEMVYKVAMEILHNVAKTIIKISIKTTDKVNFNRNNNFREITTIPIPTILDSINKIEIIRVLNLKSIFNNKTEIIKAKHRIL